MTDEIKFGELPPPLSGGSANKERWRKVAETLRSRPGEWALIDTKTNSRAATNLAHNIKIGGIISFPQGEFQATSRGFDVWARYIGKENSDV